MDKTPSAKSICSHNNLSISFFLNPAQSPRSSMTYAFAFMGFRLSCASKIISLALNFVIYLCELSLKNSISKNGLVMPDAAPSALRFLLEKRAFASLNIELIVVVAESYFCGSSFVRAFSALFFHASIFSGVISSILIFLISSMRFKFLPQ
jgi:hypothetical protein